MTKVGEKMVQEKKKRHAEVIKRGESGRHGWLKRELATGTAVIVWIGTRYLPDLDADDSSHTSTRQQYFTENSAESVILCRPCRAIVDTSHTNALEFITLSVSLPVSSKAEV